MRNTIVETKHGFLATRRAKPIANDFVHQLSAAIRLDPVEADYFADRYNGTTFTVTCADCGRHGAHENCPTPTAEVTQ